MRHINYLKSHKEGGRETFLNSEVRLNDCLSFCFKLPALNNNLLIGAKLDMEFSPFYRSKLKRTTLPFLDYGYCCLKLEHTQAGQDIPENDRQNR